MHDGELAARRHKARAIRARVVQLAREYKAACDAYDRATMDVELGDGDVALEVTAGKSMDEAREALLRAVEELEMLEEEGSYG